MRRMTASNELVQKSVRLPSELIEYIENQEGADFSKKLVGLLNEVKSGEARRKADLEAYDRRIQYQHDRLDKLTSEVYEISRVVNQFTYLVKLMSGYIGQHTQAPEDPP